MTRGRFGPWRLPVVALLGLLVLTLIPLLGWLPGSFALADSHQSRVSFYFFYSQECEHCQAVQDELFPNLVAQFGDQIEIAFREISDTAIFKQMVALEKQYGISPEEASIPEIFVGDHALVGEQAIRAELPGLIEQYLGQGGARLAALTDEATPDPGPGVVRFYLFYSETCPHCHEVMDNYLPTVYEKYGEQVEYEYIDINESSDLYMTMLALQQKLGVPEDRRGFVPALVIGDQVLIGGGDIPEKLEGLIDEYLAQGGVDFASLEDLPEVILPTPEPKVQILVMIDSNHADYEALNEAIIALGQQYQGQLEAYAMDISQEEGVALLDQINAGLGVEAPEPGTPQVLIGYEMLVGLPEIQSRLPDMVAEAAAEGGRQLPSLDELTGASPAPTATPAGAVTDTPTPEATSGAAEPIYMAYFEQAGCQECARTTYDLRVVQDQYPQLIVESFAIEEPENKALSEWLGEQLGVPEEERLATPMIVVGSDVLIGTEANLNEMLAAVSKYEQTGAERTWDDFDPEAGEQGILDRFRSFGVLTVLGAGLIDGLNPCAFATLVFFISYLAFTGRRGRDILFVGIAFALGVFITYLLVGIGLLKVIQSLSFFTALGRWLYLLTAVLCIVLAILTFRDFFKARQGQVSEMTLKLPMNLRRRINKVIRENTRSRAVVAMAFVTGFVVSLIELACTGQVYLPTIVYVMSQPELASQAILYLVLYCLMFILPLVVVFMLSYFGTSSEQLGKFVNRHTSTIKLLTGFLFVGLALWMTWSLAPLFGIHSPWIWVLMGGVLVVIVVGVAISMVMQKPQPKQPTRPRRSSRA